MNRVYFISTQYLKEHSTINNNVDENLLNSAIWEGQTIHVQQLLGTDLFDKISDLIRTGNIALPSNVEYKTLLNDYVMECVSYWAFYEAIPYIRFKVVNKGVESQSSEWSNPTDIQQLEYLQENVMNKAQFYSQRLTNYLLQNSNLFPEYHRNFEIDKMRPTNGNYFSGIVFDGGICPCERSIGKNKNAIEIL